MTRHVVGVFSDEAIAKQAVATLMEAGTPRDHISLLRWDQPHHGEEILEYDREERDEAMSAGLWGGTAWGAIAGLLVGAAEIALAGPLGVVLILGPLAAAFGGATVGAAVGGFMGSLTNLGMSEKDADFLLERLRSGHTVVAVAINNTEAAAVSEQIRPLGADNVLVI